MDTRHVPGTREPSRQEPELGIETVSIDLVQLAEVRSMTTIRGTDGFWAMLSSLLLLGIAIVIALLAIATSAGWSIVDAY